MASRKLPVAEQDKKDVPAIEQPAVELPDDSMPEQEMPSAEMGFKDLPVVGSPENVVMMAGRPVEIKSCQVKYFRNNTANFYQALELYPLSGIFADEIKFDENRDGDKCVFDWLIAVTNDVSLIQEVYNDLDVETIYKILEVFKRVNKITEKEEQVKNRAAALAKLALQSKTGSR